MPTASRRPSLGVRRASRARVTTTLIAALVVAARALALAPAAAAAVAPRVVDWTPTRAFRIFSKASNRGLPQSSVMALAQDEEGLLWIGTLDGTATFDGRTIEPVAAVPGAPLRGVISTIVARRGGGVFVGSAAGVHVFDGRSWRLVPSTHGVASLAQTPQGALWMADSMGALWTLSASGAWLRHGELADEAMDIAAAPDGALWVATESGAVRLVGGRVERVAGPPLPARPGAILVAKDGRVWVATQGCTVHWTRGGADGWHRVELASRSHPAAAALV